MPIAIDIDPSRRLVHARCTGVVTLDEILQYEIDAVADPGFDPTFSEMLDLREADKLDLSGRSVRELVSYERSHEQYTGARRVAFVAPQSLSYALARMYEMMDEESPMETQVFREYEEATAWLELE